MHMMTNSELNAILVNGFASVAGSVLAVYISFGVSWPVTLPYALVAVSGYYVYIHRLGSCQPLIDCLCHVGACSSGYC